MIREIRSELFSDTAYEIYSACMYLPTIPKYRTRMEEYLSNPAHRCFGSFRDNRLTGILIVRDGEILGIAAHPDFRHQGIGSEMIHHALQHFPRLTAETDSDAVEFYRRCGFDCTSFERIYPNGTALRYACEKRG